MVMKKLSLSLSLLILVSCASSVRNASVPTFPYERIDFTYGAPNDITVTLNPVDGKWVTESGIKVRMGADLVTILEAIYPDGDSFIYGKVIKQQNLSTVPIPPPFGPIILKNETVLTVRALQIGTHK
jgi:hypothetical protein|tara:strand:- start:201 stop:581 length:381 start_codon:yes stop_codon:yes gene_type:complete